MGTDYGPSQENAGPLIEEFLHRGYKVRTFYYTHTKAVQVDGYEGWFDTQADALHWINSKLAEEGEDYGTDMLPI